MNSKGFGAFWLIKGPSFGSPFLKVLVHVFDDVLVPVLGPLLEAAGSRNPMNLKGFGAFRLSRGDSFWEPVLKFHVEKKPTLHFN